MSKRLQVLFDDSEFGQMRELARSQGLTLAEWVRRAVRSAAREQPRGAVDLKLAVIRAAARHEFPTADIDQMLAEIEAGYLGRH